MHKSFLGAGTRQEHCLPIGILSSPSTGSHEQGGSNLVDRYSDKFLEIFEGNEECLVAMNMFEKKIDDNDYDTLKEFTQSLRNLQLPVMTRWKTVTKALKFMVDNRVPTYFMCVAVTQLEGSKSALYQICCDILSLMTLRPERWERVKQPPTQILQKIWIRTRERG